MVQVAPASLYTAPFPWLTLSTVPVPMIVKVPLLVMVCFPSALVSVHPFRSSVIVLPAGMVILSVYALSKAIVAFSDAWSILLCNVSPSAPSANADGTIVSIMHSTINTDKNRFFIVCILLVCFY